ncbi:MAG: four helix bundle protein [Sphingobacteriales bacterium]|nr:MAG: four helix bundle protein [Sphingobacteriales bacterium]
MPGKSNLIVDITFKFSLGIIKFAEKLEERKRYVISTQLIKSGTSIGANVWEAQAAESRADFIHKMKIASKEAEETEYWLLICYKAWEFVDVKDLLFQLVRIKRVLGKIISTSKLR